MRFRPILVVLGVIVVVALAYAIPIVVKFRRFQADAIRAGTMNVDLTKIQDGVYLGSYDSGPVIVQVEVTVSDHAITGVRLLKHRNGQGQAAEVMPERVISAQSLKVDIVSGATISSKVILLAIENALTNK